MSKYLTAAINWLNLFILVAVPLAFSSGVSRIYTVPKFALLITGSAALIPFLTVRTLQGRGAMRPTFPRSRHVFLVSVYVAAITISTIFGVAPIASLFGSPYNQMGLITYLCFLVLFISLITGTGADEKQLNRVLWALSFTGLIVAVYAFAQFFGRDPFFSSSFYTFESASGPVVRVNSTLGHSDYLGNFLLYTTPLSAGLSLASRGHVRRMALIIFVVSAAAIVFSGTRGAWVGLTVSAGVFVALAFSGAPKSLIIRGRSRIATAGLVWITVIIVLAVIIAFNPASRNIVLRARSLAAEGYTGSGRTLLWRDSLKVIADYPLVGCGPEGFRKAFLARKSPELAYAAPGTNNESSHNSYIDASISYGLPGSILYLSIIASSLALMFRARRRSVTGGSKIVVASLIASFVAVLVDNIFIFDQISTGLYFFAFVALAQIASKQSAGAIVIAPGSSGKEAGSAKAKQPIEGSIRHASGLRHSESRPRRLIDRVSPVLVGGSCLLFIAALVYSIVLVRADVAINKAFTAADESNLDEVIRQGQRAVSSLDPVGDYHALYGRALSLCADRLGELSPESRMPGESEPPAARRERAMKLGFLETERSLSHTLTSDSGYILLAYFALQLGDTETLHFYATKAVESDPYFSNAHWLMAEALLARKEMERATAEARLAMALNPGSREAISVFKRASRSPLTAEQIQKMIEKSRMFLSQGKLEKARSILLRAIRNSSNKCPDCHNALASVYEKLGMYESAISELQSYAQDAPGRALAEQIDLRISKLRQEEKASK